MKAIQAWITIVVILFITVEAFQWIKGFILPLPIYVLAGAFLAIASNYDKGIGSKFRQVSEQEKLSQTATLVESIDALEKPKAN
ncbi:MAG: hypothetical protein MUD14_22405 [Hydrococcus sp. Prado102]|jgi:hypothetical protein|nr:hypothetical protein [Hydrococcus sp. Prado102]